jgi:carbamoyl-phosphate synthase large subunit
MKGLCVFITGAGSPGVRGVMKCYRMGAKQEGRKIRIITCDMNPASYGFHLADSSYVVPAGSDPKYVQKMLEICKKERPDLLVSGVDPELLPLSKAKKDFEKVGTKVVLADPDAIETSQDKCKTFSFFSGEGFVPRHVRVKTTKDFKKAVTSLDYPKNPVCFKPAFSYGSRGFRILNPDVDKADLLFKEKPASVFMNFLEAVEIFEMMEGRGSLPELLVMEYLEGKEYTVDLLLKDHEPIITIPRERVATSQGISKVALIERNQEIINIAEKIARKLGLDYNANMQLKYSKDGVPKLIEVQPRLAGTTIACAGAGANLPYLGLKIALGEKFEAPQVKWGTVMKRFWEEVYTDGKKSWFYGIRDE